jgi:hypothetical protein
MPGEDQVRQLARHKDHDERLRIALAKETEAAARSAAEADRAFRARQGWMVALTEVCILHEERDDHTCKCCAARYPCATVKKIEDVNPGIARRIEYLLALSPMELERKLYPDKPPRDRDWEDQLDLEDVADLALEDSEPSSNWRTPDLVASEPQRTGIVDPVWTQTEKTTP